MADLFKQAVSQDSPPPKRTLREANQPLGGHNLRSGVNRTLNPEFLGTTTVRPRSNAEAFVQFQGPGGRASSKLPNRHNDSPTDGKRRMKTPTLMMKMMTAMM